MGESLDRAYVRAKRDYFIVATPGRRGLAFPDRNGAIAYARRLAPRVFLVNAIGKVERELASPARIPALLAEHQAKLASQVHDERDSRWRIVERFLHGERHGWFVEHDGTIYDGLEDGEDGPHRTREEAEDRLAQHLWEACHMPPERNIALRRGLGEGER